MFECFSLLPTITKFLQQYILCVAILTNHPGYFLQIKNWNSKHKESSYYRVLNSVLPEFLMGFGQRMDVMVFLPPWKISKNT